MNTNRIDNNRRYRRDHPLVGKRVAVLDINMRRHTAVFEGTVDAVADIYVEPDGKMKHVSPVYRIEDLVGEPVETDRECIVRLLDWQEVKIRKLNIVVRGMRHGRSLNGLYYNVNENDVAWEVLVHTWQQAWALYYAMSSDHWLYSLDSNIRTYGTWIMELRIGAHQDGEPTPDDIKIEHNSYGRKRDMQKNRLYAAERPFIYKMRAISYADGKAFAEKIVNSRWWKAIDPHTAVVKVRKKQGGYKSNGGFFGISLQGPTDKAIILHELAHCLAFRVHGMKIAGHGREFAYWYHQLVRRWIGKEEADALKQNFREHKVKFTRRNSTKCNYGASGG